MTLLENETIQEYLDRMVQSVLPKDDTIPVDCRSKKTWVKDAHFDQRMRMRARSRKMRANRCPIGDYPTPAYKKEHPEYWQKGCARNKRTDTQPRLVKKTS